MVWQPKKAWYWEKSKKVTAIKTEALAIYPNRLLFGLQEVKKLLNEGDVWACKNCLENDEVTLKDA